MASHAITLYPRLDLQLRPMRVPQLNEVSYGEEYEEGLEGPTSLSVIERLRRAKEFYGDVLAEFCLSVQRPVIDHRVPLAHNEAMTLPSADLWKQAEEAEIKSLNGNNVLLPTRLPAGQKLMHTKWIYAMSMIRRGTSSRGRLV